jgi:flagellar protein FlbD
MISLHKLDGSEIVLNAELIESVEPGKQTVISLSTGNRFMVRETAAEITEKVLDYRRRVLAGPAGGPKMVESPSRPPGPAR